jgi:hypothetical protein
MSETVQKNAEFVKVINKINDAKTSDDKLKILLEFALNVMHNSEYQSETFIWANYFGEKDKE